MSHRCAWLFCTILMLAGCKPEPVDTVAPVSPQATKPTPASEGSGTPAQGAAIVTQLAALTQDELTANSSKAAQYLDTFFKDGCSKDDGLPFDQSCQHYAEDAATDDPSPWPDLALGIKDGRIVSAVLFDPQQSLGDDWSCDPLSGVENVRACTPVSISAGLRVDWQQRWTAYLNAAD